MLARTQARSSGFEGDWDFGSALGIMGKAKRKTRLADYDFKRESSPARPKGQTPLSTQFLWKGPTFFRTKWHFLAFSCCTQMYLHGLNLQQSLVLKRRLHAKETIKILNEFLKRRSEKVRQILVLVRHYFSSKQRNGNGSQPKSRNRSSLDRNRTKSTRLAFVGRFHYR